MELVIKHLEGELSSVRLCLACAAEDPQTAKKWGPCAGDRLNPAFEQQIIKALEILKSNY